MWIEIDKNLIEEDSTTLIFILGAKQVQNKEKIFQVFSPKKSLSLLEKQEKNNQIALDLLQEERPKD
jgi:hypothetical protein